MLGQQEALQSKGSRSNAKKNEKDIPDRLGQVNPFRTQLL